MHLHAPDHISYTQAIVIDGAQTIPETPAFRNDW